MYVYLFLSITNHYRFCCVYELAKLNDFSLKIVICYMEIEKTYSVRRV